MSYVKYLDHCSTIFLDLKMNDHFPSPSITTVHHVPHPIATCSPIFSFSLFTFSRFHPSAKRIQSECSFQLCIARPFNKLYIINSPLFASRLVSLPLLASSLVSCVGHRDPTMSNATRPQAITHSIFILNIYNRKSSSSSSVFMYHV